MLKKIKDEFSKLKTLAGSWEKDTIVIFITIAVAQTISYYYTSRRFFRKNIFYHYFMDESKALNYEFLYWFTGDFLVFFVFPVVIIYLLHKSRVRDFGFRWGDYRAGLNYTLFITIFMLIVLWFVSANPAFVQKYPLLVNARHDTTLFWVFNAGLLIYMLAWEFIWRGYTLFGLEKQFGSVAVLIQMIPFVILHNGKPDLETFSAIPGGIALGLLALRTRSFLYGVLIHFFVMLFINWFCVIRFKYGIYGIGLEDFWKVIINTIN